MLILKRILVVLLIFIVSLRISSQNSVDNTSQDVATATLCTSGILPTFLEPWNLLELPLTVSFSVYTTSASRDSRDWYFVSVKSGYDAYDTDPKGFPFTPTSSMDFHVLRRCHLGILSRCLGNLQRHACDMGQSGMPFCAGSRVIWRNKGGLDSAAAKWQSPEFSIESIGCDTTFQNHKRSPRWFS